MSVFVHTKQRERVAAHNIAGEDKPCSLAGIVIAVLFTDCFILLVPDGEQPLPAGNRVVLQDVDAVYARQCPVRFLPNPLRLTMNSHPGRNRPGAYQGKTGTRQTRPSSQTYPAARWYSGCEAPFPSCGEMRAGPVFGTEGRLQPPLPHFFSFSSSCCISDLLSAFRGDRSAIDCRFMVFLQF